MCLWGSLPKMFFLVSACSHVSTGGWPLKRIYEPLKIWPFMFSGPPRPTPIVLQHFFLPLTELLCILPYSACKMKSLKRYRLFNLGSPPPTHFSYYRYPPAWVKLKRAWNNFINIQPHDNRKQNHLMAYFLIILWDISSFLPPPPLAFGVQLLHSLLGFFHSGYCWF